ncbi:uncharacterized protein KZ484_003483 [Pholidichthys leucotaenia]
MNPYDDTNQTSVPCQNIVVPHFQSPASFSASESQDPSSPTLPSPPVIHTGHSSAVFSLASTPRQVLLDLNQSQYLDPSSSSALPLPGSNPELSVGSMIRSDSPPVLLPVSTSTLNPYPTPSTSPSPQVSVIMPSPDLCSSHLQTQYSEETLPDLECAICFSQFNNVFQCPKMLECRHTFCLECLARINIKSAEPSTIQCPLCRSFTPLPSLGLPKLATDLDVLSYLPAAMQRVYSIRFVRSKGKLRVKRSTEGQRQQSERPVSQRSMNCSLDLGLPSSSTDSPRPPQPRSVGSALLRLTGQPACRAFLLAAVVITMVLLTGIIIFLLSFDKDSS